jgi:four helix bundle protein
MSSAAKANMSVADYNDWRLYQPAFESATEIFEWSRRFPAEERYSLTDQIRRSSRSVRNHIAEAWRKRRDQAALVSKLSDSDGETAETEVSLDYALCCEYLNSKTHAALNDNYDHICRQWKKMMDDAERRRHSADRMKEELAESYPALRSPLPAPRPNDL